MKNTAFDLPTDGRLPNWPTSVSRQRQGRYHDAADVPAALFADRVDPSVLANDTILATGFMKREGRQGIHAGQTVRQREMISFDEPLILVGNVVSERQIAKGNLIIFGFDFTRPDGSVPLRSEIVSLQPDYGGMKAKGGGGETGVGSEAYDRVGGCQLSPEKVAGYSFEFPTYDVHFKLAAAELLGFRAPIAQGLMSLTWMLAAVAAEGAFHSIDFKTSFRQPIYWDDRVDVLADGRGKYACANGDGEVCSFGRLDEIGRL